MKYTLETSYRLILICLSMLPLFSVAATPNNPSDHTTALYHVALHHTNPEILTVSLTLPNSSRALTLVSRGAHLGVTSQVSDVRCGTDTIPRDEQDRWVLPANCREVHWDIRLIATEHTLRNISSQQSVVIISDQPWILMSEFSSLPRLESGDYTSVIEFDSSLETQLTSYLPQDSKHRRILPGLDDPPVFFVFGLTPTPHASPSGVSLHYLVDEASARDRINAFGPAHLRSIEYMKTLFDTADTTDFELNVVWLGLREKSSIGGAAGYRTFLINYFFIDGAMLGDKFVWSLMTAFHEQFHVLYPHRVSQPTWVEESLAQYYAIKALSRVGLDPAQVTPARDRFIQPERAIETGLTEASRRFEETNDMSVYHLFYDQGATFWSEVDRMIADQTNDTKSLDDFIDALTGMNFTEGHKLPVGFIELLRTNHIIGIESLIERYL